MATFEINRSLRGADAFKATVEAAKYKQEGDYFVFYADASGTKKVLTVKAEVVVTIDTATDR